MRQAGILGDILPWRDVLHIGPVQNHESWQLFDQARIEFLISTNLANRQHIKETFVERRAVMNQLNRYEGIYLWFEHDLYDQLQFLQILKYLSSLLPIHDRINLIVIDLYLGEAKPSDFHELFRFSEPLSVKHISAIEPYWLALTHDSPMLLSQLNDSAVLPFMFPAFQRLCDQYPSTANGLNRVQSNILKLLLSDCKGSELFALYQATEENRFMGDKVFALILNDLISCENPLVKFTSHKHNLSIWDNELTLTNEGHAVYNSERNHLLLNDVDRWVGGVHLNKNNIWCYDKKSEQFKLKDLSDKK